MCLQLLVDEAVRWCERGGGEFRDLWSPLGMGAEELLQHWGCDWGNGLGGQEGEWRPPL